MNRPLPSLVVAIALLGIASAAFAAPRSFQIDRSHSEVGFSIKHYFTKVPGRFTDYSGTIVYDPEKLTASSVEVTIRDSSIYTANNRRDEHLRSDEFFWTEKHPTITFKSAKVVPGKEKDHFQVHGDLTIRGVSKPAVLDVEFLGSAPAAVEGRNQGIRAGWVAKTRVSRKEYGIVWNKVLDQGGVILGDDVDITLNIAGIARDESAAAAAPKAADSTK